MKKKRERERERESEREREREREKKEERKREKADCVWGNIHTIVPFDLKDRIGSHVRRPWTTSS